MAPQAPSDRNEDVVLLSFFRGEGGRDIDTDGVLVESTGNKQNEGLGDCRSCEGSVGR